MDFPFHEVYKLADYYDVRKPMVFFGMYRYEDFRLWMSHESKEKIFWTGQDALNWNFDDPNRPSVITGNVTAHPKVYERITAHNRDCELVKPAAFLNQRNPKPLGTKIYAYCPESAPEYHGKQIIVDLANAGYDIILGNGKFTRDEWKTRFAELHYKNCFIGLCLSEFAGGGESIIEMGLRGMKVVTNVFDLPNCIPWNSVEDVMQAIESETKNIGTTNAKLVQQVWNDLDHNHNWLNI
jgi:hypothetical protein